MTTRTIVLSISAASLAVLCGTAMASTQNLEGVCAVIGDPSAPYQFVMIDPTSLAKADADDIFGVTSASQCPSTLQPGYTVSPTPTPSSTPSPSPQPASKILSAQITSVPTVLPDTGGSAR